MKFTGRTCSVHCNSLPVVVVVLKFPIKDLDHWTSSSSSLVKPSQTMEFYIDIVYFLILFLAARVVMEREDETRSRGFGFVTFCEEKDAQKAIDDLDGGVKLLSTMMATNSLINLLNSNIHMQIFQTDLQESRNQNKCASRF